jgi:E3 SUMO-protein ligase PIAS1
MYVDGSWKVAPAQAGESATARHIGDAIQQTGGSVETETSSSQIIDLIDGNDDGEMSMDWASGLEDTKPLLNSQDLSMSDYLPDLSTSAPDQAEDLYPGNGNNERSNIVLTCQNMLLPSTSGLNSSSYGTLESILPQNVLCPIITDAVSPLETSTPTSGMQRVSNTVQLHPQIGPLHVSETRRPPIPRNIRREPVGVQALPVPQQNPGPARRLQPNTINCPPPIPLSSPASSTYQTHLVTNLDSVITPRNNGARSLPRTPTTTPLLHRQSSTLVTIFSSD